MQSSEVMADLRDYLTREVLTGQEIELEAGTPLFEWGIIDSLSILRLIVHIQDRFGLEVPAEKLVPEHFKDLDAMTRLVLELKANGAPAG